MNTFRKYILVLGLILAAGLLQPTTIFAQGPGDPSCDPFDPACPIDGGLSLLIAAGIGIGAKKAYNLKKKDSKGV